MPARRTSALLCAAFLSVAAAHAQCEVEHFLASDGSAGDDYGFAVALDGGTAMIGAPFRSTAAAPGGAVYVEVQSSSGWSEVQRLSASDGALGDGFGRSVAIDGTRAVVGAPFADAGGSSSGAAYVFERTGSGWVETAKLVASDASTFDTFGWSVALSGARILVGAPDEDLGGNGAAYLFVRSAVGWSEVAKLVAPDGAAGDRFGVAVGVDENLLLIGAERDDDLGADSGSAYVFQDAPGTFFCDKLLAPDGQDSDLFGRSVSVLGASLLVGAPFATASGLRAGAAYVFEPGALGWLATAKLMAPDGQSFDGFGGAVAQTPGHALVGATQNVAAIGDEGYAVHFERVTWGWVATARIAASDGALLDDFGGSVALSGDTGIVGAAFHDDLGPESGAAYAYSFAPIGTSYCVAVPSSRGQPAVIHAQGSDVVSANCLTLVASLLPAHQFGYFLASETQGFVQQPPGSQGNLCLAGSIARFAMQVQSSGGAGAMAIAVDVTNVPGMGPVLAGETWSFQGWFRDLNPGPTSNFTDGVAVSFL